jgi:predicted PurR-regulated permease PerM
VATQASIRRAAAPRSMDRVQFEHILGNSSKIAILVIGVFAFCVAMALGKFILAPISLAIVVGLMFGPVGDALERRGVPSALSAGVVVLGFLGLIMLAGALFAAPIAEWIARGPALWQKLQVQIANFREPFAAIGAVQEQLKAAMGEDAAVTVEVQDGGPVQDVALMVPTLLADILLFLAGLYFFLATRHNMRLTLLSLCFSRRMRWRAAHVFRDVESKVSRFLISATVINLGVGVATFLAMWALGMPSPLLWGGLAAVLNFIPYIGQAVMLAVLLAVGLGTYTDWVQILLPVAVYAAINITADQLVFPHLVGKALTLNPFIIFVSIAFWMWLWGPMGGFVAVPSLLVLQSFITHVFPTTADVPKVVKAKLDAKASADTQVAEPASAPPEPTSAELVPKPRRRARKMPAAASP